MPTGAAGSTGSAPPSPAARSRPSSAISFAAQSSAAPLAPDQLRWDPLPLPVDPTDFVDGLLPVAGNGAPDRHSGCGIYLYAANRSMIDRFFYSADGELLIVPELGALTLETELGRIELEPQEIAVIPRGLRFRVTTSAHAVRGYVCENFGAPFKLPDLGPIGSNGLANPRDFLSPHAHYEDKEGPHELVAKFLGRLWTAPMDHSPLDVVAWHGNNAPYKYDLRRFNTIGSISYDHPDPSIFLVLHSPSDTPGTSNIDFVVFPPRWLVMEQTFRPPVVPPQRRERVHGTDRRGLRRQGERLRAGRRIAPQLHDRPRPRRADLRACERAPTRPSPRTSRTRWPSCSRAAP